MTTVKRRFLSCSWLQTRAARASAIAPGMDQILAAAKRLEGRWETRAREAVALSQLKSLSDRELKDLAVGRSELPWLARAAHFVR